MKGLTERELEVLAWRANGYSVMQTAIGLDISEQTVKNHMVLVYRRLHVNNLQEALIKVGWLKPPKVDPWT